MLIITFFVHQI